MGLGTVFELLKQSVTSFNGYIVLIDGKFDSIWQFFYDFTYLIHQIQNQILFIFIINCVITFFLIFIITTKIIIFFVLFVGAPVIFN